MRIGRRSWIAEPPLRPASPALARRRPSRMPRRPLSPPPRRRARRAAVALRPAPRRPGAAATAPPPALPAWVARATSSPRSGSRRRRSCRPRAPARSGLDGYDEAHHRPRRRATSDRAKAVVEAALATLRAKLAAETDPQVKQDLAIMVKDAEDTLDGFAIQQKYFVPYFNVAGGVFGGLRALLDDQMRAGAAAGGAGPPEEVRRRRLPGAARYAKLAEAETRVAHERRRACSSRPRPRSSAAWPTAPRSSTASRRCSTSTASRATRQDFALLKTQLAAYDAFVRETDPAEGADRLPPAARGLRAQPAPVRRRHPAGAADEDGARGLRRDPEGDDGARPRGGQGQGLDRHRLPRRDPRAEEAAAGRRGHPAPLPGAPEGPRGDHHPREAGDAAVAAGPHPPGLGGRDRGLAGAQHAAAAPGRQHRRAGRVRAAAERAVDRRHDAQERRLHLRGGVVDADRARGAAGPRDAVRRHRRGRRVDGAGAVLVQQHQRRRLGPLRREASCSRSCRPRAS